MVLVIFIMIILLNYTHLCPGTDENNTYNTHHMLSYRITTAQVWGPCLEHFMVQRFSRVFAEFYLLVSISKMILFPNFNFHSKALVINVYAIMAFYHL